MSQALLIDVPAVEPAPEGNTPSWFTPLPYFLERERQLLKAGLIAGPFDLDPCGHPEAPVSQEILRRGGVVFTEADDGLSRHWDGRPFVNFPFDHKTAERFLFHLWFQWRIGRAIEPVVHCPAWTDRAWWQGHIELERRAGRLTVWFESGRIKYGWPGNPECIDGDGAKFPSALVAWGRR